ncbi:DNA repair protein RAD5B-like [Magnolia sinica]|uniref:DNA repair protein RAD5B-like n=1 Tax=Magnolia sinica TaxID=86752 RepID=UPI00265AE204|nr:DNA repair protein RAD5B-like [Magnolia sinica]
MSNVAVIVPKSGTSLWADLWILADAMGLGKTVMTTALILGKLVRESPDDQQVEEKNQDFDNKKTKNGQKDPQTKSLPTVKGGTLVVCPMALLGQWKNNLEDLYSLLCFLRVEPWCNWAWYVHETTLPT